MKIKDIEEKISNHSVYIVTNSFNKFKTIYKIHFEHDETQNYLLYHPVGGWGARGAQYLLVDWKGRYLVRYFEILKKIWLGNGIFNTRRCR